MEQNQCCHHQHGHAECIRIVPIFNHLEDSQMDLIAESSMLSITKWKCYSAGEKDDIHISIQCASDLLAI